MQTPIVIGGSEVAAGQRQIIELSLGKPGVHTEVPMTVHVLHGKKPGPRLFVAAALHGDEITGVEIIRRLLQLKTLSKLHGTLLAIPVVNTYGYVSRSRYLPDRRDLNRSFPGSENGSLAARMANLFMTQIVAHCSHGIDLHSGSNHRINLPQIRATLGDPETARLAKIFGAPVMIDANVRDGSLREAVAAKGIPMLLYEAGEALRFDELAIRAGLRGIIAVMREIGMLPKGTTQKKKYPPMMAQSTTWVRAPQSGVLCQGLEIGTRVKKGERLGVVSDPFSNSEAEVRASATGLVIGRSNLPLVHQGDALFHIASLDKGLAVDATISEFESSLQIEKDPLNAL